MRIRYFSDIFKDMELATRFLFLAASNLIIIMRNFKLNLISRKRKRKIMKKKSIIILVIK